MSNLTVIDQPVRQHDGLYSLNDLHAASGKAPKNQPALYMQNQQTKELISEIEHDLGIPRSVITKRGGTHQGTWVCKELVYAYAMWISARFHLQVIRAFDSLQQAPESRPHREVFSVSGENHLALQDKYIRLLEQQNRALAASGEVYRVRVTVNIDEQRFTRFAAKVKKALQEHGTLNKTRLLAECGYTKNHKTARQLLDQGTNTHWFCIKQGNVYSYALDAASFAGSAL